MKTYRITEKTAGQRNVKTIEANLSLQEAYKELLSMYNRYSFSVAKNWGMAVMLSKGDLEARPTFNDGTRCFSFDTKTYWIEEEC